MPVIKIFVIGSQWISNYEMCIKLKLMVWFLTAYATKVENIQDMV